MINMDKNKIIKLTMNHERPILIKDLKYMVPSQWNSHCGLCSQATYVMKKANIVPIIVDAIRLIFIFPLFWVPFLKGTGLQ